MELSELLQQLEIRGILIRVTGERLRAGPRSALTPEITGALREHKEAVVRRYSMRGNGNESQKQPGFRRFVTSHPTINRPSVAAASTEWCPRYGHARAWRSIYGQHVICAVCHPPAVAEIVAEWLEHGVAIQ